MDVEENAIRMIDRCSSYVLYVCMYSGKVPQATALVSSPINLVF